MTSGGAPPTEVLIQEITDKSIPTGTKVLLKGVYVTLNHSFAGRDLWLQEPNGVTTPAHPYPEYSGIFLSAGFFSATLLGNIQIGDCVDVVSKVGWYGRDQYPELSDFDTITKRDASTCGPTPEPHAIDSDEAFAGILATFDAITGGTSGPDAARYNGTLLSLESVKVRRPDETGFGAARQEGPEADSVMVFPPVNGTVSGLTEGQTLTRVVGVYSNYNKYMTFALQPRTAEEVVF
jgi:hypothetical protein